MMRMTEAVKQLLIINVIFYVGSNFIAPAAYELLALHYFQNDGFYPWQLITHMFMHAQFPHLMHIFFNMFGLVMFGSALEHFWGWKKFLFFYISCGLGAALLHLGVQYYELQTILEGLKTVNISDADLKTLFNINYPSAFDSFGKIKAGQLNDLLIKYDFDQEQFNVLSKGMITFQSTAVGASGALYGILVAFAFMFPNAELMLLFLPIPIKAKFFVPVLVGLDLYMGITGTSLFGGGGIAHFAHVGGALTGFLMMWYWKKTQFNKNRWDI
jgi:membrane associated rhomboid family serine protease